MSETSESATEENVRNKRKASSTSLSRRSSSLGPSVVDSTVVGQVSSEAKDSSKTENTDVGSSSKKGSKSSSQKIRKTEVGQSVSENTTHRLETTAEESVGAAQQEGKTAEGNVFRSFKPMQDDKVNDVIRKLHSFYSSRVVKIENELKYNELIDYPLPDVVFTQKPILLVVGEVSAGKTSFISYLLGGHEFEGAEIAEARSTNSFSVLDKGRADEKASGRVLTTDPKRPFRELNSFPNDFLETFNYVLVRNSRLLETCYIVDTPGLVKGSTKAKDGYEQSDVLQWFAKNAEKIFLVWDAQRWRPSDAVRDLLSVCLSKHHRKVIIVLSKCDKLNLKTSFDASMQYNERRIVANQVQWIVSKFFKEPEPVKILCVSTLERPLPDSCDIEILSSNEKVLFDKMKLVRRQQCQSVVETMTIRLHKCYALIIIIKELHSKMGFFGKTRKKQQILGDFEKFLADLEMKTKQNYLDSLTSNVDIPVLCQNLEQFDFGDLPRISANQIGLEIETALNEMKRYIPRDFFTPEDEVNANK